MEPWVTGLIILGIFMLWLPIAAHLYGKDDVIKTKFSEVDYNDFMISHRVQEDLADAINALARICSEAANRKGFHDDENRLRDYLLSDTDVPPELLQWFENQLLQAELARQGSEVGEAVEAVRKPDNDHHCPEYSNFEIEQADTIIRIADTCGKRDYDLGNALVAKLLFNATRPVKHGKNS